MQVNDTAVVSRVVSFDNQLRGFFDDFHEDLVESKNKALGQIYSDADIRKLIKEMRPKFVYNLFIPVLLGLIGNLKNNLPKVDVIPTTQDDIKNVELHQKLLEYYLYQANDIDYELSKAYLFSLIMKIGWLVVDYGFDKNPDGMVEINFAHPLQIKFDPNWQRKDCTDLNFITSYAWMTPEEIVQRYANRDSDLAEELYQAMNEVIGYSPDIKKGKVTSWTTRLFGTSKGYYKGKGYDAYKDEQIQNSWYNNGLFKVIDHYEVLSVPTMRVYDSATGVSEDITDKVMKDNYEIDPSTTLKDWYDNDKLQQVRAGYIEPLITTSYKKQRFMFSVLPHLHKVLYTDKMKVQSGMFKHIPVFALDIGIDATETMSIIDIIADPVASYNLRRNTILTYLMKMSNKGYIAEEWAIDGYTESFLNNKIGALKVVKNGALTRGAIEEEKMIQYPEALSRYGEQDKEDLFTMTGITPNYLGKKEAANESGILFQSRVERGDVMQQWLLQNVSDALVLVSKQAIATGQRFIRADRTIRIITEENQPEFLTVNKNVFGEIINDVGGGFYDVRISKNPAGKFAREQEFEKLISISQWIAQIFGSQFIDIREILKASNLYNKDKMLRYAEKVMQIDEQIATFENIMNFQKELQNIAQSKLQQRILAQQVEQQKQHPAEKYINLLKENNLLTNYGDNYGKQ